MNLKNKLSILTNRKFAGKIDTLELDITTEEAHKFTNTVSKYPIESGATISDHVFQEPEGFTISGIISDTPINYPAIARNIMSGEVLGSFTTKGNNSRSREAFYDLLKLGGFSVSKTVDGRPIRISEPKLIDVVSSLRLYTEMIISDITIPVNASTDNCLTFTCTFQKLPVIPSSVTVINNSAPINGNPPRIKDQNSPVVDKGKQNSKAVDKGTTLSRVADKISGVFKGLYK